MAQVTETHDLHSVRLTPLPSLSLFILLRYLGENFCLIILSLKVISASAYNSSFLSPRPTVANSCRNQCEWHRLRMEAIFSLQIWGSYRVYLYAEPERFDTMIIYESMRIRHELNTNW